MHLPLANLFGIENWGLIAVVALLIFGKRLPEVGRSLGKGIIEFKKGLAGIEEDVEQAVHRPSQVTSTSAQKPVLPTSYKFDPYTGKPLVEPEAPPMRFDPYTGKPLGDQTPTSSNT